MKKFLLLILFIIPFDIFGNEFLSLEDCKSLVDEGRGYEAIPSLRNLLSEQQEKQDFNEDDVGLIFMLLCIEYSNQGEFREILNVCDTVGTLFNQKSKVANTELSRMLWRIRGTVSMELKDYNSALLYLRQAQWMYEDESLYDTNYWGLLTYIGGCYYYKQDYATAKIYFDEALDLHELYSGPIEHSHIPDSFQLLNYIGLLHLQTGDLDKAEAYFKKVIDLSDENNISRNIKTVAISNLANLYTIMGRFDEAKSLFESISLQNPSLAYNVTLNRAFTALLEGTHDSALFYLRQSNTYALQYLQSIILNFAEAERENLWYELSDQLANNNNFFAFVTGDDSARTTAFEFNNFTRDFNLNFQQLVKKLSLPDSRSDSDTLWEEYQENRALLSYGFETIEARDSIVREVIEQERMLLNGIDIDLLKYFNENYDVDKLSKKLNDDEVVLDIISMSILKGDSIDDGFESGYSAYVLTNSSSSPLLHPICKQMKLYSLIKNDDWDAETINRFYTVNNQKLYKLIIEPLLPVIKGKNKIYLRPTHLLSLVNIGAILMPNGNRFDEEYNLHIVSSFNSLCNEETLYSFRDIALFGNAKYSQSNNNEAGDIALAVNPSKEYSLISREDRGNLKELPGTQIEIQEIDSIAANNSLHSIVYLGDDATESMFKSLSDKSPSIIHVASHGYFIANNEMVQNNKFLQQASGYSWSSQLMLYSGLLFSGANSVWTGKALPNPVDDGVLTADEISRLNLSNTALVVLSACDSGRGHFNGTDGIMGLQRAFKLAGAKTMVSSLWKVPDIPTAILMEYFYQSLFKGNSVRHSLIQAQKQLQNDGYADPYYWASFIVLD